MCVCSPQQLCVQFSVSSFTPPSCGVHCLCAAEDYTLPSYWKDEYGWRYQFFLTILFLQFGAVWAGCLYYGAIRSTMRRNFQTVCLFMLWLGCSRALPPAALLCVALLCVAHASLLPRSAHRLVGGPRGVCRRVQRRRAHVPAAGATNAVVYGVFVVCGHVAPHRRRKVYVPVVRLRSHIFAHRDVHAFPRRAPPDVIKSKYVVGKYKYVLLLLVTIMLSTIPLSLVAAIGVAQDTIHLIVRAVYGLFAVGFAIIGTVSAYKLDKRLTPAAATPKPATRSVTQPSSVGEQRKGSEPIDMCVWRCVVSVSCSVRRISCALLLRPFRTASMPPDGKPGRPRKRSG